MRPGIISQVTGRPAEAQHLLDLVLLRRVRESAGNLIRIHQLG